MKLTFDSKIDYLDKLRLHYITVDEAVLLQFFTSEDSGSHFNQRFRIWINDSVTWQGGTVNLGNHQSYISFSGARMKQIGVAKGDTVSVTLERDYSEYGFDVPEEFEELLRQDTQAKERFEKLSMGTRRAIIYMIIQLKSSEKRLQKSIFLMGNLKRAPVGNETMRHIIGKE